MKLLARHITLSICHYNSVVAFDRACSYNFSVLEGSLMGNRKSSTRLPGLERNEGWAVLHWTNKARVVLHRGSELLQSRLFGIGREETFKLGGKA